MNWLPEHKSGLYLTHNEHRDVYESIEEFYEADDFISPHEMARAVASDSVWKIQWFPYTPVGSYTIAAASLEALEAFFTTQVAGKETT